MRPLVVAFGVLAIIAGCTCAFVESVRKMPDYRLVQMVDGNGDLFWRIERKMMNGVYTPRPDTSVLTRYGGTYRYDPCEKLGDRINDKDEAVYYFCEFMAKYERIKKSKRHSFVQVVEGACQ